MTTLLEFLKREWATLKAAPFTFLTLLVLGIAAGAGVTGWLYSARIAEGDARLASRDDQIRRYRVALGIDKATEGALIELTDQEMKAKAASTAARLRDMCLAHRNTMDSAIRGLQDQKADQKKIAERQFQLMREASDEFDRTLKAETFNVDNELRRRLGPKAVAAIVGVPPSVFSASDKAALNILGLMPSGTGMSAGFVCTLGDGIDQMARLLPAR